MTVGTSQSEAWYEKRSRILFRTTQKTVREERFSAYQANIVAYTVASLVWVTAQRIDFDLGEVVKSEWRTGGSYRCLGLDETRPRSAYHSRREERRRAGQACGSVGANAGAKGPSLTDPLPPELAGNTAGDFLRLGASSESLSAADLHLIEQCRAIPAGEPVGDRHRGQGYGV